MKIRTYLTNLISKKKKEEQELRDQIDKATTADQVRGLGKTLQAIQDELRDAQEQLDNLPADDNDDGQGGEGGQEGRGANPMHNFHKRAQYNTSGQPSEDVDPHDTKEYRTAFMNFVCRGVPIPKELRATTATTDATAVIPTTILHEFIKEVGVYGEIYAKVRHLNVEGGVQIPILSLKPTATWITADTGTEESQAQKLQAKEKVSFSYYGLEVKLAQTLLTNVVTLDMFQAEFPKLAAEAMVHAMEISIVKGDGNGQMLGIINDNRVPTANVITLSAEEFTAWTSWCKKIFGSMKKAYRTGTFIMAQGTFEGYINGMVDDNGQPIARVNYGIADGTGESYRFGGKEVLTVEDDVLPSYDAAASGDVVAIFVKLSDYGVNTNMQMQVNKWTDHDTHEVKNNCILICDGKLIDPHGVLIIKKG